MAVTRTGGTALAACRRALLCAVGIALGAAAHAGGGTLLIAGGALDSGNEAVFGAYLEALPPEGSVVVIPVASSRPAGAGAEAVERLVARGLAPERALPYPLARMDDEATPDVDESAWADNGWDAQRVAALGAPAGFWFTGGDQLRIVEALLGEDGADSPLLALIRKRLREGAVVGGTSAGAAAMSRTMIAGGDGFRSLLEPPVARPAPSEEEDDGRLYLARGLGLLPDGIVDQHFDRRARLGRLIRALGETGETLGLGVDENTALRVDLAAGTARTVGPGSVTVLDARGARFRPAPGVIVTDLGVSSAAHGALVSLGTARVQEAPGEPTVGREYYRRAAPAGGGIAFPNARLAQLLGNELLDNVQGTVRRLAFDTEGRMLEFIFRQQPDSRGWWLRGAPGDAYSISNVWLEIRAGHWRPADPPADPQVDPSTGKPSG